MKTLTAFIVLLSIHSITLAQSEWEILQTDISESLHDIEFINSHTGFIYSYGTGNLYHTTDMGNTWQMQTVCDSIYLEQIQFMNDQYGWICGEHGTLLHTADGGKTWKDISFETGAKNLLLYGMHFLNESNGFVTGAIFANRKLIPKFYQTDNGGNSWFEIYPDFPHMVLNIEPGSDALIATGNGFIVKLNTENKKWRYVYRDTLKIVGQIRDIRFGDNGFGMAVSFNGKLVITEDHGDSFSIKNITTNRLRSVAYLGNNEWIVVGDNNKEDNAVLYHSNDNGKSWMKNNEFPDIHRITLSEQYIWIVGKDGLIARKKRE